jgi:hypothetical protein
MLFIFAKNTNIMTLLHELSLWLDYDYHYFHLQLLLFIVCSRGIPLFFLVSMKMYGRHLMSFVTEFFVPT